MVYCTVFHLRGFVRCACTTLITLEHPVQAVELLNSVTCFVVLCTEICKFICSKVMICKGHGHCMYNVTLLVCLVVVISYVFCPPFFYLNSYFNF